MSTVLESKLREAQSRAHLAENLLTAAGVLDEAGIAADNPQCSRLFHEIVRMDGAGEMRRHVLREAAQTGAPRESSYTPAARKLLAKEGKARPDGSYPIRTAEDVEDAVADFNRSSGSPEDKAHIVKQAKAVAGGTDKLPADWSDSTRLQESAKRLQALGVPMLGSSLGPVRFREARADALAEAVPMLDDSPLAPQRPAHALDGIPMLAEA
jgi:hypothetical protein